MHPVDSTGAPTARVAVIGAGVMGTGISQALAVAGLTVRCTDINEGQLADARRIVDDGRYGLARAVDRGKLDADDAANARSRLTFTSDWDHALEGAELVIESVPELLDLKLEIFERLGNDTPPGTILASNSSGFSVVALGAAARRREDVLVWHWASPAQVQPLAEIVTSDRTSSAAIATVSSIATSCGKRPTVVNDVPTAWGYVANRVFFAAVREAERVVADGVCTRRQVDELLRDAFGWPAGPFAVVDGASQGWGDDRQGSLASVLGPNTDR